jgi:TRAP-type C4-dicarboxylate transport system substrate-binding protein
VRALMEWICVCCLLAVAANPTFAQVIKLGTLAPEGSPWHDIMLEVAREWKELSGGKVTLRIYPGGVAGDEKDMLRKVRIGQLHATALTTPTLIEIVPDIEAISFPLLVRTDGELDYVLEKLGPEFEVRLAKKGFKVLTWSTAGWARFFTKEPVITPADMRKRKLFFWGSDTPYVEVLKRAGFHPVPLAVNDLLPSLQTGLVDSFAAPPTAALAFQWFALAPHMTALRWQPLPGTTVISMKRWEEIPPDLRPLLEDVARKIGVRFRKRVRELEQEAIVAMKNHGLTVHAVSPEVEEEWRTLIREKGYPFFVGHRFSEEMFNAVRKALDEYRRAQGSPVETGS